MTAPVGADVSPVESYLEALADASDAIVQAVHDEDMARTRFALMGAMALPHPAGVNPFLALVTVLAAQVSPGLRPDLRMLWVCTLGERLAEDERRAAA